MDPITISALLGAAFLHASWHTLVKGAASNIATLAGMNAVALAAALLAAPWIGFPAAVAWPIIIGAAFLHSGYKLSLTHAYRHGDLSQAYPVARGLTPLFAAVLAFAWLSETPGIGQLGGIALIVAGLLTLSAERTSRRLPWPAILSAAAAGLSVALYTVIDAYGVRISENWAAFTLWLIVVDSSLFITLSRAIRGHQLWNDWRGDPFRIALTGVIGIVSFGVFMWALGRAEVGAVAALRETSVLFALFNGWIVLKEPVSPPRIASAALIFLGVLTVAAT
jgi:drug/metabolite transporter (DMT)-like permease